MTSAILRRIEANYFTEFCGSFDLASCQKLSLADHPVPLRPSTNAIAMQKSKIPWKNVGSEFKKERKKVGMLLDLERSVGLDPRKFALRKKRVERKRNLSSGH